MMKEFLNNSYLFGGNAPFIEELYEKYLANPGSSVPDEWREYFDRMQVLPGSAAKDVARAPVEESFVQRAKKANSPLPAPCRRNTSRRSACRSRRCCSSRLSHLRLALGDGRSAEAPAAAGAARTRAGFYDLTEADLDQTVNSGSYVGLDRVSLRNPSAGPARYLLPQHRLRVHVHLGPHAAAVDPGAHRSPTRASAPLSKEQQKRLLQKLTEAEQLERYLHTRYVGQKRFSLEAARA